MWMKSSWSFRDVNIVNTMKSTWIFVSRTRIKGKGTIKFPRAVTHTLFHYYIDELLHWWSLFSAIGIPESGTPDASCNIPAQLSRQHEAAIIDEATIIDEVTIIMSAHAYFSYERPPSPGSMKYFQFNGMWAFIVKLQRFKRFNEEVFMYSTN